MKKPIAFLIILFATGTIWSQAWQPQNGLYTKAIWSYSFGVGYPAEQNNYLVLDPSLAIHSIALPACSLPTGTYVTGFYYTPGQGTSGDTGGTGGSPGSTIESISGPVSLTISGPEYATSLISPRYVNACNTSAPSIYPFTVHFYIVIDKPSSIDTSLWQPFYDGSGYTWVSSPTLSIGIYSGNLLSPTPDIAAAIPAPIGSFTTTGNVIYEFDVPAGEYAIITLASEGSISYQWSVPHQDNGADTYVSVIQTPPGDIVNIYYSVDNTAPSVPENALRVQDATIISNDQQQDVYYTASDPATLTWTAVNDLGTKPYDLSEGATVSGTASYDLWADGDFTTPIAPNISNTQQPGIPENQRRAVVQFTEGSHTVYLTAKDNAGMDSRYTYNNEMQKTNPDNPVFNSLCRIVVDRSGPEAPGNLKLSDPLSIAGKEDFAKESPFTLAWTKPADLPTDKQNAGIGRYVITLTNTSVTPNTITTIPVDDPNAASVPVTLSVNGRYSAVIKAYDRLGNEGAVSDAYIFNVDTAAPTPPMASSFSMAEPGTVQAVGDDVIIDTASQTVTLSFHRAADGSDEWQSGVKSYELGKLQVINGQSVEVPVTEFVEPPGTGNLTLAISGLTNGTNEYKLYAVDEVGNRAATFIKIEVSQLSEMTFPEIFYVRENGQYWLVWNPPSLTPPDVTLYYKAIVKQAAGVPSAADWTAAPQTTETRFSLAGQPLDEYLYAYVLVGDDRGDTNVAVKRFKLPASTVPEGTDHEITENEIWWSGLKEIHSNVIVRAGATLYIQPGCVVRTFGNVKFVIEGTLKILGDETDRAVFEANENSLAAWQGIYVTGTADIQYADIKNALRGVSAVNGASVTITNTSFINDRVGLHVYNAHPTVTGCRFERCQWYGVKEDAIPQGGPRPEVKGCVFTQNGYDYYHDRLRDIDMDKLNEINGITADADKNRKE
jgi:hypothetical protein